MANPNRPFGLKPVRYLNGSPWDGRVNSYYAPSSDANNLFIGDPVILAGSSNTAQIERVGGTFRPGRLPSITIAAAGSPIAVGVVTGIMPVHRDSAIYREASVESIVLLADDPRIVFQIQDDGSGAGLTAGDVSLNAQLVAGSGGSTVTGKSSWQLDATTPAGTNTFPLKMLNVADIIDRENNLGEDFIVWEVAFNVHQFGLGATGVV